MGRNMLEHQKKVIENVSHNEKLIRKEISKSHEWLDEKEFKEFKDWLKGKYNINL